MGNALVPKAAAAVLLEVRLSPIQAEPPRGRNGLPCDVVARVGALADEAAAREVRWEEAVTVELPSEKSAVLITLHVRETGMADPAQAEERFLTQVCLPYRGVGCLAELGVRPGELPVALKLLLTPGERHGSGDRPEELAAALRAAREGVRPDLPCLSLSVRELEGSGPSASQQALDDASWSLPTARRQLIALELQNAALRRQRGEPAGEEAGAPAGHVRQLHFILEENERIRYETARMRQKLHRTKTVLADSTAQAKREANAQSLDWAKTLSVMQHELAHCKERQQKIRENYEERVAGLQGQLQQARRRPPPRDGATHASVEITFNPRSQANAEMVEHEVMTMQARIKDATLRRDDLLWHLGEAKRKAEVAQQACLPMTGPLGAADEGPDIQRLRVQSQMNEVELEGLRQELALQRESQQGSERQQGLRASVAQLYEELDECHRAREDERVRSESEIRELKAERDTLRDRVDDAASEVQRSRSQAEVLRAMREQAESNLRPGAEELHSLREGNAKLALQLEQLALLEEKRKQRITELEREQELLVEQTSLRAAPLAEGGPEEYARALEARARELAGALELARSSCKEHERAAGRLRKAAGDAVTATQVLRRSYEALRFSSDMRPRTSHAL